VHFSQSLGPCFDARKRHNKSFLGVVVVDADEAADTDGVGDVDPGMVDWGLILLLFLWFLRSLLLLF
jgi:hypothetical protein